jgi:predicted  nucleic acid-binding Zn-ribbon protein
MKDTAPTPPDMSKEQAAELKQLRRAISKVESDINKEENRLRRDIAKIDRAITTNRLVILRRAQGEIKEQAAAWLKEAKPLKAQLARLIEGRAPAFKVRDSIAKRIAILEGRLAS